VEPASTMPGGYYWQCLGGIGILLSGLAASALVRAGHASGVQHEGLMKVNASFFYLSTFYFLTKFFRMHHQNYAAWCNQNNISGRPIHIFAMKFLYGIEIDQKNTTFFTYLKKLNYEALNVVSLKQKK
jgi:hypothetical protein